MSLYYNYYKSIHLPFSRFILGVVALSLIQAAAPACAQSGSQSYTLKQAIDYALQKNAAVNNAQLDIASAKARVGETRAIGLPQISVTGNFTHNIKIQQFVLENVPGSTFGYDQNKPAFAPMPLALSLNNSAFLAAQLNQILFSGSYIVALRASGTFQELSQKSLKASRIQVAGSVSKAYYSVLVAEEQLTLLDKNINRLDSTFRETQQMNVSGFVEKIDVDRVEVALNNLKAERQNTQRMVEVSRALLKYQMGMEQQDPIQLTDRLQSIKPEAKPLPTQNFEHSRRIEYSLLQTQRRLNELDMQNIKSGYLPSLSFSVSYGTNSGAGTIGRLTEFGDRWYPYSVAMLNLNIPIFDGLSKSYQGQQKKLSIMKTDADLARLRQTIDFQLYQSNATLQNSLDRLNTQKRNFDLAQEVVRVTRIKYQQGVGANIEVTNAEASLKEAQTNYYAALFDLLIAKVDLDIASGDLLKD